MHVTCVEEYSSRATVESRSRHSKRSLFHTDHDDLPSSIPTTNCSRQIGPRERSACSDNVGALERHGVCRCLGLLDGERGSDNQPDVIVKRAHPHRVCRVWPQDHAQWISSMSAMIGQQGAPSCQASTWTPRMQSRTIDTYNTCGVRGRR